MSNRKPIAEATTSELLNFAETGLGIEIDEKHVEDREKIIALMVSAGYKMDSIKIMDMAVLATAEDLENGDVTRRKMTMLVDGKKTVIMGDDGKPRYESCILIPSSDKDGGEEPVPVGVNGSIMWIPRDVNCWVPDTHIESLKHAVAHQYDEYREGMGGLGAARKVTSYPFTVGVPADAVNGGATA